MKRIVLLFLIISLVLAFTIFTGCVKPTISKGTTSETKVEETAATTVETTVEKKKFEGLSLILWEIPSLPKAFDLLVEGFENETGAKIERIGVPAPSEQAILQKWAAGERPDILNWHPLPNWFLQLRPEETLIDLSNEEFVKKTINNYLDGQTELNGKYYGPILIEPYLWGMWYSKEVFNRVGINMPEDTPVGYTGLLEMYKKIKDAGETPLFMGGGDQWPLQVFPGLMWLEAFGDTDLWNELNTNKAMWTDERIITGISKLKELQEKGFLNKDILTATYVDEQEAIISGKAAMVSNGGWILQAWLDKYGPDVAGEKIGFFPISLEDNIVATQFVSVSGVLFIPKTGNTEKEQAAIEFIRYITGPKYQEFIDEGSFTPMLEGFKAPEKVPQIKVDVYKYLETNRFVPEFNMRTIAHYGSFETFLQEMLSGLKTPEEVGEALQEEWEASAKELGLEGF